MNNQQFRDLFRSDAAASSSSSASARSTTTTALGAKKASFAPKPSRPDNNNSNTAFAQQIRTSHAQLQQPSSKKKIKSSAPKGSAIASGYVDRAAQRAAAERKEDEERRRRIRALEEQVRLGTLSAAEFETLKEKISAGDDAERPKVKGLDRTLLERARRGEDVLNSGEVEGQEEGQGLASPVDVEDELDRLGEKEIAPVQRERREKTSTVRAPAPVAGVKRSRDEIMAELKAKRQAAAQEKVGATPVFDHRWRKVGEQAKPRIEIDHKGREVLITVDEDGIVKRMVRKAPKDPSGGAAPKVDQSKPVLGADFALPARKPEEPQAKEESDDDDDDIFAGAGTHYDPLGAEDDDDDDSSEDGDTKDDEKSQPQAPAEIPEEQSEKQAVDAASTQAQSRRNYFTDPAAADGGDTTPREPDPQDIQNIIKRAAQLRAAQDAATASAATADTNAKLAKLQSADRDYDDLDMGFGSSRFEDDEDGSTRLAQWKRRGGGGGGGDDEDDGWEEGEADGAGGKRKRKPKKRKGDGNNIDDVMRVLEGRRAAAKK